MEAERSIPEDSIVRMVELVEPTVTIRDAELAVAGSQSVYHLNIEADRGSDEWVLKAPRDESSVDIGTEARLLTTVAEHTSIPVPEVIGLVDTHETFPTPYLVMERLPGENLPKRAIGALSDDTLERIARESGRYLAELHQLDGPSGFGLITTEPDRSLVGERPAGELEQLRVTDLQGTSATDTSAWPRVFRAWAEDTLSRIESTQFGDLTDDVRPVLEELIDRMDDSYLPVIGRVDHGLHNLLIEPDTGEITGVIDWAFTMSIPATYDVVCVEANLAMDPWSMHPSTPDRRELVRSGIRDGYLEIAGSDVAERTEQQRSAYLLLALLRAMEHLDMMPEFVMRGASERERQESIQAYRRTVKVLLENPEVV